jgi:hypothetical protein
LRTDFLSQTDTSNAVPLSEPYKGTMTEHVISAIMSADGKQPGDPAIAADRIVEMIMGTGMAKDVRKKFLRLPLTKETGEAMRAKAGFLKETVDALEGIWTSVDY